MRDRRLPGWVMGSLAVGGFVLLNWLERRRPLRARTESKLRREVRNVAFSSLGALATQLVEAPVVLALMHRRPARWSLLTQLRLPLWAEIPAALALMDYTYFAWHVLLHRVPLLWRFHLVHHVDLDMDASTALRFHAGEVLLTLPYRVVQVALIGLNALTYSIWQTTFLLSILFHHSDVELPVEWERRLNRLVVTPRMHGIHHSAVAQETASNWSSGLSIWDWLHGTLRLNIPQREIAIGVPAWRTPVQVGEMVSMPFRAVTREWELPGGGQPAPHRETAPRTYLLA